MTAQEEALLQLELKRVDFRLEALRWRLEAHARDLAELQAQMRAHRAQSGDQTRPFPLRPLRKCEPL